MHAVTTCLILVALACIAPLLARAIRLPLPFLQIGIGILAALPPFALRVDLDPPAFLLLFIPPLLFGDGWAMPRRALHALRWPVLGHAVGLVLLTVAAAGYGLHWLIPDLPLSVAFAIAALVSPTDAVAVAAITEGIQVPSRMMHLLENEALLNDATGLVAMRFAVAATLSGAFSLPRAAGTFVLVATGGLAIGWGVTLVFGFVHRRMLRRPQDAAMQTILSGLLPFAAYGLAEHFELSGILAAVGGGMAASRIGLLEDAHFSARLQTVFTWNAVSFALNGVIFVLLGLQLPGIVGSGPNGIDLIASDTRLTVLAEIAALTACLIVLRLAWVLASLGLGRILRQPGRRTSWRVLAASSLAGVRGAVTLAGVLSLPVTVPGGGPFPGRDLAITLATGVILGSMLIASITLPLLLRRLPAEGAETERETRAARIAAVKAAIGTLEMAEITPSPRYATLVALYQQQLAALGDGESAAGTDDVTAFHDLHRAALRSERDAVKALRDSGDIDDAVARRLVGELDLLEAALTQRTGWVGPDILPGAME